MNGFLKMVMNFSKIRLDSIKQLINVNLTNQTVRFCCFAFSHRLFECALCLSLELFY